MLCVPVLALCGGGDAHLGEFIAFNRSIWSRVCMGTWFEPVLRWVRVWILIEWWQYMDRYYTSTRFHTIREHNKKNDEFCVGLSPLVNQHIKFNADTYRFWSERWNVLWWQSIDYHIQQSTLCVWTKVSCFHADISSSCLSSSNWFDSHRYAWVGQSSSYPAYNHVTINLGTVVRMQFSVVVCVAYGCFHAVHIVCCMW